MALFHRHTLSYHAIRLVGYHAIMPSCYQSNFFNDLLMLSISEIKISVLIDTGVCRGQDETTWVIPAVVTLHPHVSS